MKPSQKIKLSSLFKMSDDKREELLWGENSRRDFIKKSVLSTLGLTLGSHIAFAEHIPIGHIPLALLENDGPTLLPGKHKDLIVLNDKPWNIETPPHLLNDSITPVNKMFVRNNGLMPEESIVNGKWTLKIAGESVTKEKAFTLEELKNKFKHYTLKVALECGGNGRHEFNPPAKGNQWKVGAIHCGNWTGIRLKDVLNNVGIRSDAKYIGFYAADKHLSKNPKKAAISRGVPIKKALQDDVLLAFKLNGEDIPYYHGKPLRLIVPGYPASASGKWVNKIVVRNKEHDGTKMDSYRVPCSPVEPGSKVDPQNMCIIESMPVKSLITYPKSGGMIKKGESLRVNGHAWAGEDKITKMHISIDYGSTWQACQLEQTQNIGAWQDWSTTISFPGKGYYEIWAKATDNHGASQPMVVPQWNPKGYINNACHRIAIKVV